MGLKNGQKITKGELTDGEKAVIIAGALLLCAGIFIIVFEDKTMPDFSKKMILGSAYEIDFLSTFSSVITGEKEYASS